MAASSVQTSVACFGYSRVQISQYCEFANVLNQSLEEEALSVWIFCVWYLFPKAKVSKLAA